MMIVSVAIGTRISSLKNLRSYFKCMKNQSTRPALVEAITRFATMLQAPSLSAAASIVMPVSISRTAQMDTNVFVFPIRSLSFSLINSRSISHEDREGLRFVFFAALGHGTGSPQCLHRSGVTRDQR